MMERVRRMESTARASITRDDEKYTYRDLDTTTTPYGYKPGTYEKINFTLINCGLDKMIDSILILKLIKKESLSDIIIKKF